LQELVVRSCLICRKSEETNEIVLGYSLCSDCRLCFDDLLASDKEPDCVNDPECLCATFECPKCVKVKLCQYGFFKSFQMKTHGTEETKCFRPNDCCVCKKSMDSYLADDKEWMDMVVCTVSDYILRHVPSGRGVDGRRGAGVGARRGVSPLFVGGLIPEIKKNQSDLNLNLNLNLDLNLNLNLNLNLFIFIFFLFF
jgi:hypothetical protein